MGKDAGHFRERFVCGTLLGLCVIAALGPGKSKEYIQLPVKSPANSLSKWIIFDRVFRVFEIVLLLITFVAMAIGLYLQRNIFEMQKEGLLVQFRPYINFEETSFIENSPTTIEGLIVLRNIGSSPAVNVLVSRFLLADGKILESNCPIDTNGGQKDFVLARDMGQCEVGNPLHRIPFAENVQVCLPRQRVSIAPGGFVNIRFEFMKSKFDALIAVKDKDDRSGYFYTVSYQGIGPAKNKDFVSKVTTLPYFNPSTHKYLKKEFGVSMQ